VVVPAFITFPLMVKVAAFALKLQAVWLEFRLLKVLLDGVKTKPSLEALTVYCPPGARLASLYDPSASVVAVAVAAPLRVILTPPSPVPLAFVTRPEMERVVAGDGDGEGVGDGDGEGVGDGVGVGDGDGLGVGVGDAVGEGVGVGVDSFVLDESDFR
jgi:hypothetical protein